MAVVLTNYNSDQLQAVLAGEGVSPALARRLLAAAVRRGELPEPGRALTARLRRRLEAITVIPHLTCLEKRVSPTDGFAKYLFSGEGAGVFEAVRIPLLQRPEAPKCVVCVSSQVGCAMGCAFCATGRLGFRRNLAAWEIVEQVLHIRADSPYPVSGVVFMGMGEPMLNYEAVMTALEIFSEPCGLALEAKAITVSTCGLIAGIRRFTAEGRRARLVVSLSSANPALRRRLLPVEQSNPTAELLAALRDYHRASGQRVTLAWTMISGLNTTEAAARELAALTAGLPIKLDLIDVNDPEGQFRPPGPAELNSFRDALRAHVGMPVARRYSGGQDIQAACGMLAGSAAQNGPDKASAPC